MIPTREQALSLFLKYNKSESLLKHAFSVEGVMRYMARKAGEDEEKWGIIGLVHDLDYEMYPDQHCKMTEKILKENGWPPDYVRAVMSHGWGLATDVEPVSKLEKTIYAVDELTGLVNRRYFMGRLLHEYERTKRYDSVFTVLMIDLDFFKKINDTYGHTVGDQALRLAAGAIQNTLRSGVDRVGRFGGDEFIILLPEASLVQAVPVMARLRANVSAATQNFVEGIHEVTLSIGAAELEEATRSLDELIERADHLMYADKKQAKQ